MKRREFITLVGGAVATSPVAVRAQQVQPMRLIGVLIGFAETDLDVKSWFAAFRGALAKLGWTEGSNFRIDLRWAGDDPDKMKTFAKELVELRPDAILSVTTPATDTLVRETQTIPIVMATVMLTGSRFTSPRWVGNGWNCSSEPRRAWREWRCFSTRRQASRSNSTWLQFKPPRHRLPSRRVLLRFTPRMRSKALSPH